MFSGRSGAGKTTLSRLAQRDGLGVLSDDMNAIVPKAGALWAECLPFAGDLGGTGRPGTFPLRGLCRLGKGPRSEVRPLDRRAALVSLLSNASFVNTDPHRFDRLWRNLTAIARAVTPAECIFAPDSAVSGLFESLRNAARGPGR